MGCCKSDTDVKNKDAKFSCSKCGVKVEKKGHACKPVKVKSEKKEGKKDGKKGGKKKD